MDKKMLMFGRSGRFAAGVISNYPSTVYKTAGLNGILQPYQIYVREASNDGPYIIRTKLTTNDQDPMNYSKKMTTTEYIKGHGQAAVEKSSNEQPCPKETETPSTHTSPATCEIGNASEPKDDTEPIKISEIQFKRKLSEYDDRQQNEKKKKKMKHSFNLY